LYFNGQLISNTGNWLTNVALTLLVFKLTHSGLDVGLLAVAQYGPILFLSAWAGAIADRSDKHKLLYITQSLEMVESAVLAVLAFTHNPPIALLYVVAVAGGAMLAFDNPLRRSFVSEMVRKEDIPNAVVLYSTIVNLSRIFGPAIAGLLVVTVGYGWCFTLDALSYLAVIYSLKKMRTEELYRKPVKPRQKGEIREGVRYVLSQPGLWISFAMLAVIGTLSYNFAVTLPLLVADALHKTATNYTILYAVLSCGSVTSALIVAHRRLVQLKYIIFGAFALGITMIVLGYSPNLLLALPITFFVGMSSIVYLTSTTANIQVEARSDMVGRVLALQSVLTIGPTAIGGLLLGWMADAFGGRSPMVLGGVASLLASIFGYFAARKFIGSTVEHNGDTGALDRLRTNAP
jgi:MFS family permease